MIVCVWQQYVTHVLDRYKGLFKSPVTIIPEETRLPCWNELKHSTLSVTFLFLLWKKHSCVTEPSTETLWRCPSPWHRSLAPSVTVIPGTNIKRSKWRRLGLPAFSLLPMARTGYIGYFFHCCYQMPGKGNLKKEGARFRGDVACCGGRMRWQKTGVAAHLHRQSGSREGWILVLSLFPPFIFSFSPWDGTAVVRVSLTTLNSITLTIKSNLCRGEIDVLHPFLEAEHEEQNRSLVPA